MNNTMPHTVAVSTMPKLAVLLLARKQARWQWKNCADEHKHRWSTVCMHIDGNIDKCEKVLASQLGLSGFRAKREIVE